MGERTGPESGETTLAAATAAIITARWAQPPANGSVPGHAAGGSSGANGHTTNGHGSGSFSSGFSEWAPPAPPVSDSSSPPPFAPVSPPGGFAAPPVSPAPIVHSPGSTLGGPAAATFFAAVSPDPVPEVFDDLARADTALPTREAGRAHEEVRTKVPPGFERRNFGPFPDEPVSPPASGGGWSAPAEGGWSVPAEGGWSAFEPRADNPVSPAGPESPSALLGVVPPASWSQPLPPTLAPPEPAPWVDTGWEGFDLGSRGGGLSGDLASRGEDPGANPEQTEALVGAGTAATPAAHAPLPRRVPRVPDLDYPLFDSDPVDPTPDPATERHELNRIADYLRDEAPAADPGQRPDGVDLEAVLSAVRQVPEVRDAQLRWNAQAGHTLRIEFADGVDECQVTRSVVRLLRNRLGLAAQPSVEEPTVDSPYRGRVSVGGARGSIRPGSVVSGGRPLPRPSAVDVPRLMLENVTVTRLGAEATVEVRLRGPRGSAVGEGRGPGVDAYLSRLAATAAARAVDQVLAPSGPGRVFVEHVSVVPFGVVEVAVVVLLLTWDEFTEQLSGSAIVGDDPHQAVVRATLAALNRRLESLL